MPMKLAHNVEMLEVTLTRSGQPMTIYPTLTWNEAHLVLIDTGLPGAGSAIARAIADAGFKVEDLTEILLTHQDIDHIGGTRELLALAPDAKVYAPQVDAPYIDGAKVPTKLATLEARKANLTTEEEAFYHMLKEGFAVAQLPVDTLLKDGDVIDLCGGIETVFTPGHTPGHTSYFLRSSQIMVAGDAANIVGQRLKGSNPPMTWDMKLADESLDKLKAYKSSGVISYHTGYLKY
ncbi:MBL fold metallo-hydrolase [Lactococcus taiwanensis]|uniref:MBL fold metallo-hydrolase n=1 Tax=Lactococcus taiwanensis TaxID=1151742 RepID=UPI00289B0987|nr:MBL fold metallo-hydrolase [Lactococcus taiwanensis]